MRRHGDLFERSLRGFYRAHGRADDTMNLGGIKVIFFQLLRVKRIFLLRLNSNSYGHDM